MPTPTNGFLQKLATGVAMAALLAGAGALVTQAQLEEKVKANSEAVEKASVAQVQILIDVSAVKTKVAAVEKAVEKNGDKLDAILQAVAKIGE